MAKLKYSKLKLKANADVNIVDFISDSGDKFEIEVKQYLPITEKVVLVTEIVNKSVINGIVRADLLNCYTSLAVVQNYTNLEFTEKQLEKNGQLYDELESNGLIAVILDGMDLAEWDELKRYIDSYSQQMSDTMQSSISGYSAQQEAINKGVQNMLEQLEDKVPN